MIRAITLAAILLLSGCVTTQRYAQNYTTIGEDQQVCEQINKGFPEMVDCLNEKVTLKATQRGPDVDLQLAYVTRARALAQKVRDGKISDSTARKTLAKEKVILDDRLAERQNQYYESQRQKAAAPVPTNTDNLAILNCIQAANLIPRSGVGGPAAAIASCHENPYRAEDRFQREKEDMDRRNRKMICKPDYAGKALECSEEPF